MDLEPRYERFLQAIEGRSHAEIEVATGLSRDKIKRLSAGSTQILDLRDALRLARFLGISPYWLAGEQEPSLADRITQDEGDELSRDPYAFQKRYHNSVRERSFRRNGLVQEITPQDHALKLDEGAVDLDARFESMEERLLKKIDVLTAQVDELSKLRAPKRSQPATSRKKAKSL